MSSRRIEFFDGFTSETTPTTEIAQGPVGTALPLLQAKYTLAIASALTFTGSYYTLPLDTTEFEDTGYSNASGVITVTEAGRYNINARAVIGTAALERIDGYIQIYKNGTTVIYSSPITSYMNLSDGNAFNINNVLTLAANDTIQIRIQIDSHWGASFDPVFSTDSYVIIKRDEGLKGDTGAAGTDGVGLPTGGTTGQHLVKNSATNYDISWETEKFNISGQLDAPVDQIYTLDLSSGSAYKITGISIISSSGTCTVDIKINGVIVTGLGSLSVTSTINNATATALNNVIATDKVDLVVSSNSSALLVAFSMKCEGV